MIYRKETYDVQNTATEAAQLTDNSSSFNVDNSYDEVVADNRKEPTVTV